MINEKYMKHIMSKSFNDIEKYIKKYSQTENHKKLSSYLTGKQIQRLTQYLKDLDKRYSEESEQVSKQWNNNLALKLGLIQYKKENRRAVITNSKGLVKSDVFAESMRKASDVVDYCVRKGIKLQDWQR